jgi:hypothetical protein
MLNLREDIMLKFRDTTTYDEGTLTHMDLLSYPKRPEPVKDRLARRRDT